MVRPLVLVDLDGVILRASHPLHDHIAMRCNRFVGRYAPGVRNPRKVCELNNAIYRTYGHTVLGLARAGLAPVRVDTQQQAPYADLLDAFNTHVYDHTDASTFRALMRDTDVGDARAFLRAFPGARVFSNAPDGWVRRVGHATGIDLQPADKRGMLKPDPGAYKAAAGNHRGPVVFIDDAMINLSPVMDDTAWTKVLFCGEPQDGAVRLRSDLFTVSSLQQAAAVVAAVTGESHAAAHAVPHDGLA